MTVDEGKSADKAARSKGSYQGDLSQQQLTDLMKNWQAKDASGAEALDALGGVEGVCAGVHSDPKKGLSSSFDFAGAKKTCSLQDV